MTIVYGGGWQGQPDTSGSVPKKLTFTWDKPLARKDRDPHCRNSHHSHYVPESDLLPEERGMRFLEGEDD